YPWKVLLPENIYPPFQEAGLEYGSSHRCINSLNIYQNRILGNLTMSSDANLNSKFYLSPGLVDSVFQVTAGFSILEKSALDSLPFRIENVFIYQPCPNQVWVHVQQIEKERVFNIDVFDENGIMCMRFLGFET